MDDGGSGAVAAIGHGDFYEANVGECGLEAALDAGGGLEGGEGALEGVGGDGDFVEAGHGAIPKQVYFPAGHGP